MLRRNGVTPKSPFYLIVQKSFIYMVIITLLFGLIGFFTTISPTLRISSHTITNWTSGMEGTSFVYLLGMENRAFYEGLPEDTELPGLSASLLQIATSIKPNDPRSLLGNELPGFSIYDSEIFIAGEGTNYTNLPVESTPPLEDVLRDRDAIIDEDPEEDNSEEPDDNGPTTGEKNVVYIYNTHNYESFLPHLPGVTNPDLAQHNEVNVTMVSDRLAKTLRNNGIGTVVSDADTMKILDEQSLDYTQSYAAIRDSVEEAFATNKDIQYVFDIHRDSLGRKETTKEIDGVSYAKVAFVIGGEYEGYEKNLELATKLHYIMEEKYPGLSRGVLPPKKGPGTNGVFNQDLHDNAVLIEIGGVDNNFDELYRSADALAEVFSEFYWEAEKVNAD
ncbi:stage II sporulation protein P [Ornithinibacillus contaminans]|uniref:stage II sporulation protein P n=1 Tax=Ornithinibacillus contaminans TaxID=694055 RepID=UPI00069E743B|nr:stage II sporulation protein P [Ornithinibacillus contaminans]